MTAPYGKKVKIYIFAMVMSHSRKKYVCFQLKPFSGSDFVMAHDRHSDITADGQPKSCTIRTECCGNLKTQEIVIYTEIFEATKLCRFFSATVQSYDPESKVKLKP